MEDWDPHVILGLAPDATRDDVRRAYRRLARMYHPDSNPGDERAGKRFRMIQRAYRTLSDPSLAVPETTPDTPPAPAPEPVEVEDDDDGIVIDFDDEVEGDSGDGPDDDFDDDFDEGPADEFDDDFDDDFEPVGPQATDRTSAPERKPRLRMVRVEVPLKQVLKPGATYLDVPGVGRAAVKIPAGADTGTVAPAIVRKGDSVERLAVELRVLPDRKFRRRGLDLVTRYRVDTQTAWRGKTTYIKTPWGRVRMTIPARSRWGDVVRIPCKGIMGKNGWGSLFIELSRH